MRKLMQPFLDFFRTGRATPVISRDPSVIHRLYEKYRWSIFLSVTFGYGIFYVTRVNFSVVKKPLLDEGIFSATQMGVIGSALLIAYAAGKLTNGFLADRANVRRFMSFGLAAAAIVNLILGFNTAFVVFVGMWAINGWFQSMGAPSSVVSLSNWFSFRERGTRYGIWSVSHSIGEGLTFFVTALLVSGMGWRWGFWGPGLLCLGTALVLSRTMSDRPETRGLPPVAEYKDDPPPVQTDSKSVGHLQIEVLKNPAVWVLGLASACMYVARYGINNWGILYLQEGKGYPLVDGGTLLAIYAISAVAGSFLSGIISDKFFNSRRNVPALFFGVLQVISLTSLFLLPPGTMLLDLAALIVFGFAMGVLVAFLGGLMAIDIVSHRAAGAAAGVVGMFSYIGAAIQDTVSGILIDGSRVVTTQTISVPHQGVEGFLHMLGMDLSATLGTMPAARTWNVIYSQTTYGFEAVGAFWIGASIVSAFLPLLVWNAGHGKNAK